METVNQNRAKPEDVVNGHDMNQDILQLIGYVHTHGVKTGEKGVFDSEHMIALSEVFLRKYRELEIKSPKAMQNNAHQLKALLVNFKSTKKDLRIVSDKLSVHEYYMNLIQKIDRSHGLCSSGDNSEYLMDCMNSFAHTLEREASEHLTKPESFDDIEDDWTATGNGTSPLQNS